jgi:hypothetical protein
VALAQKPRATPTASAERAPVGGPGCEYRTGILYNVGQNTPAGEPIFVIARLGDGEASSALSRRRLINVSTFWTEFLTKGYGRRSMDGVRTMLWAGDVEAAQGELARAVEAHRQMILDALKVRNELVKQRRKLKEELEPEVRRAVAERHRGKVTKARLHSALMSAIAKHVNLGQRSEVTALFAIAPVALKVARLYEGIKGHKISAEEPVRVLRQSTFDFLAGDDRVEEGRRHEASGFKLYRIARNDEQLEVRAYRLNAPLIDLRLLMRHMEKAFEAAPNVVDGDAAVPDLPLWLRLFTPNAFLELTVLSEDRVLLNAVLSESEIVAGSEWSLIEKVFDAIAHSQQHNRRPDD